MMINYQPTRSARTQGQTALQGQAQQQQKLEQAAEKVEQILEQATQAPFPQNKLLGSNKALNEMQNAIRQDSGKERELKLIERLLENNKSIREKVDHPKRVSDAQQYSRPVIQVEEDVMNNLMGDLVHPDADQARKARERLVALGGDASKLDAIAKKMKEETSSKTRQVRFGGPGKDSNPFEMVGSTGNSLHDLMRTVRQQITAHSDKNAILNAGCDQQLDMLHHAVKPLLFGSGAWVTTSYDHNGYPVTEWSNNGP